MLEAIAGVSSTIPGVEGIGGAAGGAAAAGRSEGFSNLLTEGLSSVSELEAAADSAVADFAAGGGTQIHEVMAATAKASLGMQVLTEVRTKAVEAYQTIINIQV